jgi:hypothetical protein
VNAEYPRLQPTNEDGADKKDTDMKAKIWALCTVLADENAPAMPAVFASEMEAWAKYDEVIRAEWDSMMDPNGDGLYTRRLRGGMPAPCLTRRRSQADLFLGTLPYNAHSTASDWLQFQTGLRAHATVKMKVSRPLANSSELHI